MFAEAREAPGVVRRQLARNAAIMQALGERLRTQPPRAVVTLARGSSDHAATFAKYLFETRAGVLTASAAPSTASVYRARQDLRDCLFIAISQSGRSPDLIASAASAREAGACVVALVNDEGSPLAAAAEHAIPLCAGAETSVAATKSWLAALAAMLHMASAWTGDADLADALHAAPDAMDDAWSWDWSDALALLEPATHLYVIGRGLGLALAQEAALKCKETCGLHAEAFSAAEVRHGPQALLGERFPALVFAQQDETRAGIETLASDFAARGVPVLLAGAQAAGARVLQTQALHAAIAPLALGLRFYRLANELSLARGFDPDNPPHLRKVTETH
jgi:glucosamine--fructose-6-phosphate aminotransferase (isomerizing)